MARIDETGLQGKIRDRPISNELRTVLLKAADASGVDVIYVTSGGQPGSSGQSVGSTRHNGGRAADLQLIIGGKTQTFDDVDGGEAVERFVTAAAANGATGIGAGVRYMGPATLHIGFGRSEEDHAKLVWGVNGASVNAPAWLREAASRGWNNPPPWVFQSFDPSSHRISADGGRGAEAAQIEVPRRFTLDVIKAAQRSQRSFDIPASVTLAQWALESGFGQHMPPKSNNPFGIKARGDEPSVTALTTEVSNGRKVSVMAAFRAFGSLDDAFEHHARLLATASAYAAARRFRTDPDRFADALTGVYATDPNYGTLLKSIMRSNNLYRFDELRDSVDLGPVGEIRTDITGGGLHQGDVDMVLVTALQQRLVELGYSLGKIDGKFGTLTVGALLSFQNDNGLPTTGVLDDATQAALRTADRRRLDEGRVRATEKDLAADGSRVVINAERSRFLGWIAGAFGAVGIGNSAVVNAVGATTARPASSVPDALLPFLADVQRLQQSSTPAEFQRVSNAAKALTEQLGIPAMPPEVVQLVDQLRRALPQDLISKNPDIARVFDTISRMSPGRATSMNTIFDILPSFFASDSVLQTAMKGLAVAAGSVLPGFGGSLAILGIGVAGRLFANRIAEARVEDHQNANNIAPLKT